MRIVQLALVMVGLSGCVSETFVGGGEGLTITVHHEDGDQSFNWPGANKKQYKEGSLLSSDPVSFMWDTGWVGVWGPTEDAYVALGLPFQTHDNVEQHTVFWVDCHGPVAENGWEITLLGDCEESGEAHEVEALLSFCQAEEIDGFTEDYSFGERCESPEEFEATVSWRFDREYKLRAVGMGAVPYAGD